MSREVHVNFAVKSLNIMKRTLNEMGIAYSELGEILRITRNYHDIAIDAGRGSIGYDHVNEQEVNQIKQNYMINWYKNEAIKEGMQLRQERQANGAVVLTLLR